MKHYTSPAISPVGVDSPRYKYLASYYSPDRSFRLDVESVRDDKSGPAKYTLSLNGTMVWMDSRDFTLWDCRVTSNGVTAGYAYETDYQGKVARWTSPAKSFIYVIAWGIGGTATVDQHPRGEEHMNFNPALPARPTVEGLTLDAESHRFTVWMETDLDGSVVPFTYSLDEPGKRLEVPSSPVNPRPGMWPKLVNVTHIPGTTLDALEWAVLGKLGQHRTGACVVTLTDPLQGTVWDHDFGEEYQDPELDLRRGQRPPPRIGVQDHGFSFKSRMKRIADTYAIERDEASGMWVVQQKRP